MDLEELVRRLQGFEWSDLEFKGAQREVPKDAYKTVSAFANTKGGHLVFGVAQDRHGFEIVVEVDRVQNDFLSALRSREKISFQLDTTDDLIEHGDKHDLVFYVPEAPRQHKPVYLNGDIRRSFMRSGAADVNCSEDDIRRFLRNAGGGPYEGEPLDLDPERCFDADSLRRYRRQYAEKNINSRTEALDDLSFLEHWAGGRELGQ